MSIKKIIKHHQKRMALVSKINTAIKELGFLLCEFSGEDEECDCCNKQLTKSDPIYYRRTCYEVEEGEYYCGFCVLAEKNSNDDAYYEAMANQLFEESP